MLAAFNQQLNRARDFLANYPHAEVLSVNFRQAVEPPGKVVEQLAVEPMRQTVDPQLYRERAPH